MFKLILLLAVFTTSDKPPLMHMLPAAPQVFGSKLECEAMASVPELKKAVDELRGSMVKKFKQDKVSVSLDCIQVAPDQSQKSDE